MLCAEVFCVMWLALKASETADENLQFIISYGSIRGKKTDTFTTLHMPYQGQEEQTEGRLGRSFKQRR